MFGDLTEVGDKRTASWPLMNSFIPTAVISCSYVLFVIFGPVLMKNRQPFDLHIFVLCHNVALVFLNVYTLWLIVGGAFLTGYDFICQPLNNNSTEPGDIMVAKGIWWYYILRAVDLVDTIVLILRKKSSNLSFLHVYHHATMFPLWFIGAKFVPGGNAIFGPLLNSFVHIVMYIYYAIAELGPKYRKYLWWKKYLTIFQMVQFILVICHSTQTVVLGCNQPFMMLFDYQIAYLSSLLVLFLNFYFKQYSKSKLKDN